MVLTTSRRSLRKVEIDFTVVGLCNGIIHTIGDAQKAMPFPVRHGLLRLHRLPSCCIEKLQPPESLTRESICQLLSCTSNGLATICQAIRRFWQRSGEYKNGRSNSEVKVVLSNSLDDELIENLSGCSDCLRWKESVRVAITRIIKYLGCCR